MPIYFDSILGTIFHWDDIRAVQEHLTATCLVSAAAVITCSGGLWVYKYMLPAAARRRDECEHVVYVPGLTNPGLLANITLYESGLGRWLRVAQNTRVPRHLNQVSILRSVQKLSGSHVRYSLMSERKPPRTQLEREGLGKFNPL